MEMYEKVAVICSLALLATFIITCRRWIHQAYLDFDAISTEALLEYFRWLCTWILILVLVALLIIYISKLIVSIQEK